MGKSHRVISNGLFFNSFPTHKLAFDIVNDFIRVHVTMSIWCWDGFRVVIEQPGYKRTDHKSTSLECLVNRGRLVDLSGNRHKIIDVEYIGEIVTIPTDQIKGVMLIAIGLDAILKLYFNFNGSIIYGFGKFGCTDVSL